MHRTKVTVLCLIVIADAPKIMQKTKQKAIGMFKNKTKSYWNGTNFYYRQYINDNRLELLD